MTHYLSLAMRRYAPEPGTRKYIKGYQFLSFAENIKKLFDRKLGYLKFASKKAVHKTGEYLGNKIADSVTKSNDNKIKKHEKIEEMLKK